MKLKLYELAQEEKQLQDLFLMSIDEETGEVKNTEVLEELETELKNALVSKSAGIIKVFREQKAQIEMVKAEIERLGKIKEKMEKGLEGFENYIKYNMVQMEIQKIETPLGNISVRQTTATDVYDKKLVPEEFMKPSTTYRASLTEIKKAIESGIEVPGARLIVNTNLTIK